MNHIEDLKNVFTDEYLDGLLITRLMEQYHNVIGVDSTHPEDIEYDKVLLDAMNVVIGHNLSGPAYREWKEEIGLCLT
jgi:hypothetical protein